MDRGALQHALETRRRFRVLDKIGYQHFEFAIEILAKVLSQPVDIHTTGAQHGHGVPIVTQGKQQMLECCVFMTPLAR
jgi:hypothetical protein